jgi:hypothetical protein
MLEMIARALAGLWLVPKFGFLGACFANPLAWLFADCLLVPLYFICMKKLKSELDSQKLNLSNVIASDNA